jgi:hypothetical protein
MARRWTSLLLAVIAASLTADFSAAGSSFSFSRQAPLHGSCHATGLLDMAGLDGHGQKGRHKGGKHGKKHGKKNGKKHGKKHGKHGKKGHGKGKHHGKGEHKND